MKGALDCVAANRLSTTESTEVFAGNMSSTGTLNEPRRDVESQSSKPSTCSKHRLIWWRLTIDVPLLFFAVLVIGLFELGVIPGHKWGFYCNDPALSYKFTGDTVTMGVLMSTLLLLPLIIAFLTEYIFIDPDSQLKKRLIQTVENTFWIYKIYIFGLLVNVCIVELMKGVVGAPRPSFFDICEPDAAKTCNGSEFVSKFVCTSTKYSQMYLTDSYRSFPSGHTSMSVFCGFFLAWYLQKRAFNWSHRTIFLVPVLLVLCASYAAICSLTRITDHRHHWWDVLFGAVVGVVTLYYAVAVLGGNFSYIIGKSSRVSHSDAPPQPSKNILYDERQS